MGDICRKVKGAYCRPGMRGCILAGKVTFQDDVVPTPVWPAGADPRERARAEAELAAAPEIADGADHDATSRGS